MSSPSFQEQFETTKLSRRGDARFRGDTGGDAFIYTDTAIAHARLADIPPSHVINCWELPKLVGWLDARRK